MTRRRKSDLALRLVAGGSLGGSPPHSIDRAPTSWLMLASGLIAVVTLAALAIFIL